MNLHLVGRGPSIMLKSACWWVVVFPAAATELRRAGRISALAAKERKRRARRTANGV